jgi:hypothetical protein
MDDGDEGFGGKAVRFAKAHISRSRYGAPGFGWSGSSLPMNGKRATADPPFGFAQGRLCGDDNQNGNCNCNGRRGAELVGKSEGFVLGGLLRDPSLRSG